MKVHLLIVFMFYFGYTSAQQNDTIIYFDNNKIAVKKTSDSILFYNSDETLTKIIDLKIKKSTQYGLPQQVKDIIVNGKIPERLNIFEETFPTYLYTQRYIDERIVLCNKTMYYNKWGLNTGFKNICPDDTGGKDYHFGGKNLYTYNKFGQLITIKGENTIRKYNGNGQLIGRYLKNSNKPLFEYTYTNNKIVESKSYTYKKGKQYVGIKIYFYNEKGLLKEIISKNYLKYNYEKGKPRKSILFEYNDNNQITKVMHVEFYFTKNYHTFLEYKYDDRHRLKSISINHKFSYSNNKYNYQYDDNDNIISISSNGKTLTKYKYDNNGRLIHISNHFGEEKGFLKYE